MKERERKGKNQIGMYFDVLLHECTLNPETDPPRVDVIIVALFTDLCTLCYAF